MELGYHKPLYVLPFDHRFPYANEVFGFKPSMTAGELATAAERKQVIYRAFQQALADGVPAGAAAILVDEQHGADILGDAASREFLVILPTERSGAAEFELDYGQSFADHIEPFDPAFVKVLVKHNPQGDRALNARQLERILPLVEYCRQTERRFMFELIVPAESAQLAKFGGDAGKFDRQLRPGLTIDAIHEIQQAGVEPDVWKLEGLDTLDDCRRVGEAVRRQGRDRVGCVVLGRGEDAQRVRTWLTTAARVPAFIGFAVGRSIFSAPLLEMAAGKRSTEEATREIATRFRSWVEVFESAREGSARHRQTA